MDDVGHVRLIDSHSERVRSDHYILAIVNEILLIPHALTVVESRVIARCGETVFIQKIAYFFNVSSRLAVNDSAFIVPLTDKVDQRILLPTRRMHLKIQIRSVKARDYTERRTKRELFGNIVAHELGCRRGKRRNHGTVRQGGNKSRNFQIARSEIVAPLRNAMCLIDRDHSDIKTACEIAKALRFKPLGGDIHDLIHPRAQVIINLQKLIISQRAVDISGGYVRALERHDLILHQGDQRRHDKGDPPEHQSGDLITKALSAARRHYPKHVAPAGDRIDQALLPRAKFRISEIML